MAKYFDQTFFKFLVGFVAILAISFSAMIITNYVAGTYYSGEATLLEQTQTSSEFRLDESGATVCLGTGDCR